MKSGIVPERLKRGDMVRVIAPARSMAIIGKGTRQFADAVFAELGLALTFSAHVEEVDFQNSASVQARVKDLHEAFADPNVKAIFTTIGGFNSNQLLEHLDWELIARNPKILCGYSDITILANAIFARTGLQTYYGPHYSTLGQKFLDPYTVEYLKKCLFESDPFQVEPSKEWTDDKWFLDQGARLPISNEGYWVIQEGEAQGTILGGNLCTLNLLQGTPYMPTADGDVILLLEDDAEVNAVTFDRDLESLLQTDLGRQVKGVIFGRFQKESNITREDIAAIVQRKPQLTGLPVVANVDFGHTNPMITFPIGGKARLVIPTKAININLSVK